MLALSLKISQSGFFESEFKVVYIVQSPFVVALNSNSPFRSVVLKKAPLMSLIHQKFQKLDVF